MTVKTMKGMTVKTMKTVTVKTVTMNENESKVSNGYKRRTTLLYNKSVPHEFSTKAYHNQQ